jgi:hypothetical protein
MEPRLSRTGNVSIEELTHKKRRHERSSCSCREASDATYFQLVKRQSLPPRSLEYIHHSIDSTERKYKNRNYISQKFGRPMATAQHPTFGRYLVGRLDPSPQKTEHTIMANSSDSSTSSPLPKTNQQPSGWLRVAAVAAASALAGGIAAAWWHRKTLAKLRQSDENGANPDFRIYDAESSDEP